MGYRRYVLELARETGVAGYVRNEGDGSVAIFAQGDEVKLKEFLEKTRNPPPPARVREVKEVPAKADPRLRRFSIKFGSVQEELQEGFGAIQGEFGEYRNEFKDYRAEFRGFAARTDENFERLEEKYGEISEKLTNIMTALAEESKKSRGMLEVMKSESKQTGQMLSESLRLLKEAVDRMPRQA